MFLVLSCAATKWRPLAYCGVSVTDRLNSSNLAGRNALAESSVWRNKTTFKLYLKVCLHRAKVENLTIVSLLVANKMIKVHLY